MVYWARALKTFLSARDQLPASRICDLRYEQVRRDPILAARSVYEHFGWRLTAEIGNRMRAALARQQASHPNGVHRYHPAYFPLRKLPGFEEYRDRPAFSNPPRKITEQPPP